MTRGTTSLNSWVCKNRKFCIIKAPWLALQPGSLIIGDEMRKRLLKVVIVLTVSLLMQSLSYGVENSRLQSLVTSCLDSSGEAYCETCPWPRRDSSCLERGCREATTVWRESSDYVAIQDKKMCNCPSAAFIHGLAIPRALVSGVEAANRPNGIWRFAWQVALEHGIQPDEAALVVNPKNDRSENQLHLHIVRLKNDARSRLDSRLTTACADLENVWGVVRKKAQVAGLDDYGVLVVRNLLGGFLVQIVAGSPEDIYTQARCPK